ncbi:response regulator, partial [bacterium]|nr:response regulator [bacterium]
MIDLQKKKFLVIDDFPDFIKLMKRTLFALGANNMDEARSGEQAIELMKRNSYDIIMCDYNLGAGKKDGQQILEEAKHSELIRHSTVYIMLTAENTMTMVMGAVEYQPDAYLLKPISKEVLGKRIETLLLKKADFENIEAAIARKEYNSAIALCEEKIKTSPKNKLEYLKLKSDLCIRAGNLEAASVVFEEVLAIRDIPWAKLGRGKVYFLEGSYLNAREIFQAIIQENKMFMEAYDWLAKTLEELEDMDSAKRVLINATEISPKAILRHQNIGNLAFKTNDFDKAAEAFNAAI